MIKKIILFFLLITLSVPQIVLAQTPELKAGDLVKVKSSPAVYYLSDQGTRHLFPNAQTYYTWYGQNWSKVKTITTKQMSLWPLGKNITIQPGKNLVQFNYSHTLYAVEAGGVLRPFNNLDDVIYVYGDNWKARLLILPDAVFNDYTKGKIVERRDFPNDLVYKFIDSNKKITKYYWKSNEVLTPLANPEAALANHYQLSDAVAGNWLYNYRKKEITGFTTDIFNPAAKPQTSTADCENKQLKAAAILVYHKTPSAEEINKIQTLQKNIEPEFKWSTDNLAQIDTTYPLTTLAADKLTVTDEDGQEALSNEVINLFYDSQPDVFDFIYVYNNFLENETNVANYIPIRNDFLGTGKNLLDRSYIYGSHGKLKGILVMGNLAKYSISSLDSLRSATSYHLHELLHHWSGSAFFTDQTGRLSDALLVEQDPQHWNMYDNFISPLGGWGWRDNNNDTFTSGLYLNQGKAQKFSDLDLYLMGLLPARNLPSIGYLIPKNPEDLTNTIAATFVPVTFQQIIQANGEWDCSIKK